MYTSIKRYITELKFVPEKRGNELKKILIFDKLNI